MLVGAPRIDDVALCIYADGQTSSRRHRFDGVSPRTGARRRPHIYTDGLCTPTMAVGLLFCRPAAFDTSTEVVGVDVDMPTAFLCRGLLESRRHNANYADGPDKKPSA